jgi:hypothetical protein
VTQTVDGPIKGSATVIPDTLRTLAAHLSGSVLTEAVALSRDIADPGWRMAALVYLAPYTDQDARGGSSRMPSERRRRFHSTAGPPTRACLSRCSHSPASYPAAQAKVLGRSRKEASNLDPMWRVGAFVELAGLLDSPEREALLCFAAPEAKPWNVPDIAEFLPPDEALAVTTRWRQLGDGSAPRLPPNKNDGMAAIVPPGRIGFQHAP